MYIQQLYTNCLAEAAYYIESNGEAAIIDPLRETTPYLELAKERGATIKYVFETHFHADFVSGHIDLAHATDATIIYGPTATAGYNITVAEDRQEFALGNLTIRVLHTPGHTMESSCFLVLDEDGKEQAIFTGDTLFVGDVGRPDLAVSVNVSREALAAKLYDSLQRYILTLPDEVIVYPGHGAGSQCGKNLGTETVTTIGAQRKFNYALQQSSEEAFVRAVTDGLQAPPQYFPKNAQINKTGYKNIDEVLDGSNWPCNITETKARIHEGAIVVDTRTASEFCAGYIPGSINIGLDGFFAVWAGTLIEDLQAPIVLVADPGKERECILRLARVGFENVVGFLSGGYASWDASGEAYDTIDLQCPARFREQEATHILDVRTADEFEAGHWQGAINRPLASIQNELKTLDKSATWYVYCKSGYRSMIAASLMKRQGFKQLVNIKQGYEGLLDPESTCCSVTHAVVPREKPQMA